MNDPANALIIIPDVHGRPFWRQPAAECPQARFIFLGDYLDPYPGDKITDEEAFQGLADIIAFKKEHPGRVTLIWGNHDLHYLYPELLASRYDFDHAERNAHMFWDNQEYFQMALEVEAAGKRILLSHAGVGRKWLSGNFPGLREKNISAELLNGLVGYPAFMSSLEDVSTLRGGDKPFGSMVWADVREHILEENSLKGVVQIFGHTRTKDPINYENRVYCLDCGRAFSLNLEDGLVYDLATGARVEDSR